jgi:hypothetical protein
MGLLLRNSKPSIDLSPGQKALLPGPQGKELRVAPTATARQATRVRASQEARHIRRRGLYMGTDTADAASCYLAAKWLRTGVHVLGPTGTGKSRLLLWLFQLLCHTNRPIVLIDPKGGLYRMARDWALANGLSRRLVLFDLGSDILPGYNPLRENGLRIDVQAQWVREGIKSAWGADSFDATPLLARMLYLCLYVARAMSLSLMDALDVLRPMPTLRHRALRCIEDPFVHGALDAFDRLNDRIKTEQAASTVSRLEMFVCDETVRTVICSSESLDLEELLAERRIILVNFAKYQPLLPDALKLLGRMFLNDLLAHIYKGHGEGIFDEHQPCYFIADEVQNFATTTLCDALDEGRGIGFHSIIAHQHLSQLADEDKSGYLLRSVMNDARTKIIFGDLAVEDLEIIAKNVMLDRYSPWALKDELTSPVFAPVETTRVSRSVSRSRSHGRGLSLPESVTEGTSESISYGTSESMTLGVQESRSEAETHGTSRGTTISHGETVTDVDSWAETDADGESWADGESEGASWAESSAMTMGQSAAMGQGMVMNPEGEELTETLHETAGTSAAFVSGMSAGGSRVHSTSYGGSRIHASSRGGARGITDSISESVSESESESHTTGTTTGESLAIQHGTSEVETTGTSHSVSHGRTPSWSEEESESISETVSPFHEYHREDIVSSRTYLTPEEQTLLGIQILKAIPKAHFALKTPENSACLIQAPWVDEPWISKRKLTESLARVYAEPGYVRLNAPHETPLPAPPAPPVKTVTPELLPPAQKSKPSDDHEQSSEGFLF